MAQITTTELATELGTDGRTLRKFLRATTPKENHPGKGSRWVLEGNKRDIARYQKQFAEWTAAQEKARAEREEKAETVDEVEELDD